MSFLHLVFSTGSKFKVSVADTHTHAQSHLLFNTLWPQQDIQQALDGKQTASDIL